MISPLALSLVFKNRSHFNMVNTFLFTSTRSFYSTSSKPSLSDQRSSRNYGALRAKPAGKGKSDSFFQRVYDKSANNPLFIVNNFFKQYPNTKSAGADLDYKLINTILGNHTSWHRPLQHRRTASSYEDASVIRKKIGVSLRGIKSYSTNAITIDPLMLDFFTSLIQEHSEETIVIKLSYGRKLTIPR